MIGTICSVIPADSRANRTRPVTAPFGTTTVMLLPSAATDVGYAVYSVR